MKFLLPILFLASCAQKPDVSVRSRLYEPNVLILAPNTVVKTVDGDYVTNPVNMELWYPSRKIEEMEKQLSQF